ncbi:hypothetical protein B0F90DRAFT_918456 [Multifurca ochricompacta]|uniref:Uncharacterized protein n=1 Tax=Multifurca ochricompacta TaxID=376703 RepID=A0AAD4QLQ8_9AGAM|nr:hypothetical protein B0F90DRAFT_918456 [Multifurca ochricompacta]
MGPLPRSADSSFRSVNSSFSTQTLSQSQPQSQSQSQGQKQPEVGPSNPSRSYIPVRAWPSSSVDGTDVTPSLTSDGDAEQGPDEPLPPTPPRAPAVVVNEPEDSEVEALPPPPPATKKRTPIPLPPRLRAEVVGYQRKACLTSVRHDHLFLHPHHARRGL